MWSVARTILDRERMEEIVCSGSAVLRRDDDALAYDEAVSFHVAGKLIAATRAYRFKTAAGAIVAMFADGSPFFIVRPNAEGFGAASHICGDDLYELSLTLRAPATWETVWSVTGTKRLRIATRYGRCAKPELQRVPNGRQPSTFES